MNKSKKLVFLLLFLSSFFMTGCDADSIAQVINDVSQAVQEVIPAVQSAVQSISDAFSGISNPGRPTTTTTTICIPVTPETSSTSTTGVTIPSPSSENVTTGSPSSSPADQVGADASASVQQLKEEMRSRHGINAVDDTSRWTSEHLAATNRVLDTLPESFKRHTQNIRRRNMISNHPNVLGAVVMGVPTVHVADSAFRSRSLYEGTLIHEMTHTFQANNRDITDLWNRQFWSGNRPRSASVSAYGNSNALEDMAESVREYWQNGSNMKRTHPDRYEFIRRYVMDGEEY